jgi:hypothetical protein
MIASVIPASLRPIMRVPGAIEQACQDGLCHSKRDIMSTRCSRNWVIFKT